MSKILSSSNIFFFSILLTMPQDPLQRGLANLMNWIIWPHQTDSMMGSLKRELTVCCCRLHAKTQMQSTKLKFREHLFPFQVFYSNL